MEDSDRPRRGGYEDSPACRMLATNCAICGKELVDAESVERGIGPDCARRYGYGSASGEPDWREAGAALDAAIDLFSKVATVKSANEFICDLLARDFWGYDAHKSANVLVNFVAREASRGGDASKATVGAIVAIIALGYRQVAEAILTHRNSVVRQSVATIKVENDGERLMVKAPYSEDFNARAKAIVGSRWHKDEKVRSFPVTARRDLWNAIKASFPAGSLLISAKGVTKL